MNINGALSTVTNVLQGIIGLGMTLAATALVVDLLFPGTTNIVGNVSTLVNSFISQGLVGLIALIVFVALFSND